jgi:hypothetical protein
MACRSGGGEYRTAGESLPEGTSTGVSDCANSAISSGGAERRSLLRATATDHIKGNVCVCA